MGDPIPAQRFQGHLGQEDETILLPLRMAHMQQAALAIDVAMRMLKAEPHAETDRNERLVASLTSIVDQLLQLRVSAHREDASLAAVDDLKPLPIDLEHIY